MRLKDKVIIVTGSTMGIGKAIAERCVAEGALVVIHGLEQDLGKNVVNSLGNDKAALHIEDIILDKTPENLVETALSNFGKLDAVVNNAAAVKTSTIHTADAAFFRDLLEINTIAPYALIRAALPELTKNSGRVLNIGSVNAWGGEPELLHYSATKGALTTLTRNLGDTLHREEGVQVNQINPGWVLTEKEAERKREHGLPENWYREVPPLFAPSGRILFAEEIAAAAVYWLGDESGPVSGQVVDLEQYPMMRNLTKNQATISQQLNM